MKRTALLLIIIAIFSKVIGFGREITLAYFFGASNISDAYIISLTIPTVIFSFIGEAIMTGYIPLYNNISSNLSKKRSDEFTNNLISMLLLFSGVIVLIGTNFSTSLVKMFASGFDNETLNLAANFTKISLYGMLFTTVIHILKAYLQVNGNYRIPAFTGIPMNIVMMISMYLSYKYNNIILAYGIVASIIIQLFMLIPASVKKGFKYNFRLNFRDPHVMKLIYLSIPVIVGVAVNDINKIVDRTIASRLAEGAISALNYAGQLNSFVQGIVVMSVATAMYPLISKMASQNNISGLKITLCESINYVNLLVIPASLGAMVLSKPIVEILFGRGQFNNSAILMTSGALFFYAIGMPAVGLREILTRPFYALQNTKIPMLNASFGVVINIVLNIILSKYFGVNGLALATSISAIITCLLMIVSLRYKIGQFGISKLMVTFIKIVMASLVMAASVYQTYSLLENLVTQIVALTISIIIGVLIYTLLISFMKISEIQHLFKTISLKIAKLKR